MFIGTILIFCLPKLSSHPFPKTRKAILQRSILVLSLPFSTLKKELQSLQVCLYRLHSKIKNFLLFFFVGCFLDAISPPTHTLLFEVCLCFPFKCLLGTPVCCCKSLNWKETNWPVPFLRKRCSLAQGRVLSRVCSSSVLAHVVLKSKPDSFFRTLVKKKIKIKIRIFFWSIPLFCN